MSTEYHTRHYKGYHQKTYVYVVPVDDNGHETGSGFAVDEEFVREMQAMVGEWKRQVERMAATCDSSASCSDSKSSPGPKERLSVLSVRVEPPFREGDRD